MHNAEESFAAYNWDGRAVKSHCSSTLYFIYYARIRMTIVRVMMSRHYHQIVYIHSILAYSTYLSGKWFNRHQNTIFFLHIGQFVAYKISTRVMDVFSLSDVPVDDWNI